jgi:hypothetical protein
MNTNIYIENEDVKLKFKIPIQTDGFQEMQNVVGLNIREKLTNSSNVNIKVLPCMCKVNTLC